jgi:hypothetical protein
MELEIKRTRFTREGKIHLSEVNLGNLQILYRHDDVREETLQRHTTI